MEIDLIIIGYGLITGIMAGFVAGLLAGLTGLGGGLIYVPLFLFAMPATQNATSEGVALHIMASLVAVCITGFFSARAHWKLAHIDTLSLQILLPGLVVGATVGLWSTLHLSTTAILSGLVLLNVWVAWDLGRQRSFPPENRSQRLQFVALPIGYCSGALGIGGGTMLVPLLRRFLSLRFAVGTSAICGFLTAALAVIINTAVESNWQTILEPNIQFLMAAWLGIAAITPYATRISATVHKTWPEAVVIRWVRWLFILIATVLLMLLIR